MTLFKDYSFKDTGLKRLIGNVLLPAFDMIAVVLIILSTVSLCVGNSLGGNNVIRLTTSRNHTVFSGELPVKVFIPSSVTLIDPVVVDLVSLQKNDEENVIHSVKIPLDKFPRDYDTEMLFSCNVIDTAGRLRFRLTENGTARAESDVISVDWPKVIMTIPWKRETLAAGDIKVVMTIEDDIKCNSSNPNTEYHVELLFRSSSRSSPLTTDVTPADGVDVTSLRDMELSDDLVLIDKRTLKSLANHDGMMPFAFPCGLVDRAGEYQAVLRAAVKDRITASSASLSSLAVVGQSNVMQADWSSAYSLSAVDAVIFPCKSNVVELQVSKPKCGSTADKVRLFNLTYIEANESVAKGQSFGDRLMKLEYFQEKTVSKAATVTFGCAQFNQSTPGYCFKYISVARNNGVNEQAMICLPTTSATTGLVKLDEWDNWSDWTSCVVTRTDSTCGTGIRSRFRKCNSLIIVLGSKYCKGSNIERESCDVPCSSLLISPTTPTMMPVDCQCGCALTAPEGHIVTSATCQSRVTWTISVQQRDVIRLKFERFSLEGNYWVEVRDGNTPMSNLLLNTGNEGEMPLSSVKSTQNHMTIEVISKQSSPGEVYKQVQFNGFIATYVSLGSTTRDTVNNAVDKGSRQMIWESAVTVAGIVLCVIVIVVTVGLVLQHHVASRRRLEKLAQTPVHQALLGRPGDSTDKNGGGGSGAGGGEGGGSSVEGSANISFADSGGGERRKPEKSSPQYGDLTSNNIATIANPYHSEKSLQFRTPDSSRHAAESSRHRRDRTGESSGSSSSHGRSDKKSSSGGGTQISAPMAFEEDLSPTASPAGKQRENTKMKSYESAEKSKRRRKKNCGGDDDEDRNYVLEKRPPVEGRDSLTRDKNQSDPDRSHSVQKADFIPPTRAHVAEIRDLRPISESSRPTVKPLSLRLTDDKPNERNQATSPLSNGSTDMSPDIHRSVLFEDDMTRDAGCASPLLDGIVATNDDFEYDDYIPHLPGSYFSMDPHAYTLTWSQQPQHWANQSNAMTSQCHDVGDNHQTDSVDHGYEDSQF